MISIIVASITMGLVVLVSTLYRGRGRRANLLHIACVALFIAVVCRGIIEPVINVPSTDLVKRLAILTAQVTAVQLILTFRTPPVSQRMTQNIYLVAGLIAAAEFLLAWFLPVQPGGSLYHKSEIAEIPPQSNAWALVAYQSLYLSAFVAAIVVAVAGCWRVMTLKNQPISTLVSVGCLLIGALGSTLFVGLSIMDLFGHPVLGGSKTRTYLIIAIISVVVIGLTAGVIRRIGIHLRKAVALHLAYEIVLPLWQTMTTLHPGVKLPPEERLEFNQLMALSRLTIETHDALRLIQEDNDSVSTPAYQRRLEDPYLSAELLRRLSGESAVPCLGRFPLILSRLRTFTLKDDEALANSIQSLYKIRIAMNAMS